MKQLTKQSDKNSPAEYDRIFQERAKKDPHWQDLRRWKELVRYFKSGRILDLGCLDSGIPKILNSKSNFTYLGIDVAGEALKEMSKNQDWRVQYLCQDIYKLKLKNRDGLDYAILGEVLEHLDRPKDAVREAFRVLKSGGVLAISVPLEEAIEPGAVDGERHLWSFSEQDIYDLVSPLSSNVKFKVLRSKWFPRYKYCWPQLICWAWKK